MNNIMVVGSIIGDQLSATVASNTVLLKITQEDLISFTSLSPTGLEALLQIRNHSSFAPVINIDGHSGSGSQVNQSNLNLVIFLIRAL